MATAKWLREKEWLFGLKARMVRRCPDMLSSQRRERRFMMTRSRREPHRWMMVSIPPPELSDAHHSDAAT